MKTIEETVSDEIVVKKSKFIANIYPVNSEEEAKEIINSTNKKYHDAKHNCYAYTVLDINENITKIEKSSDNGEPSGTAGAPMLDLLKNKELVNVLVIVTRYFGGILLGTGGLVKAYTDVTKKALSKAKIIEKEIGNRYYAEILYNDVDDFIHFCKKLDIKIKLTEYKEKIEVIIEGKTDDISKLMEKIKIDKLEIIDKNILI